MGKRVMELEQELNAENVQSLLLLFVAIALVYFFMGVFGNSEGALGNVASFITIFVFPFAVAMFIYDLQKIKADPQRFIEAYRADEPQTPEIEILEKAYSKAQKHISEAFRDTVILWLVFGAIIGLTEAVVATGNLEVRDFSRFWILMGTASLLSIASFVLMVAFYLRKRSIEKALFAIQLKESDKAEISIKI